jgi:membrane protein DedA with SNARE-associated domain
MVTIDWAVHFILQHGYVVLFAFVFAEQIGLPIPAVPILMAVGALAAKGLVSFPLAMAVAGIASVLSDLIWYELGRRRGSKILSLICRISLEPDSCVRRTEDVFATHGARALLYAKFVPGLNIAAPPLAGLFKMKVLRFVAFDGLGALIWASGWSALGYVFEHQLELAALWAMKMGGWLALVLVAGLAAYVAWKYVERRRFLRGLSVDRITPDELLRKLESNEPVVLIDLRHSLELEDGRRTLPRAMHFPPEEIERRLHEIPAGREVVLYCT